MLLLRYASLLALVSLLLLNLAHASDGIAKWVAVASDNVVLERRPVRLSRCSRVAFDAATLSSAASSCRSGRGPKVLLFDVRARSLKPELLLDPRGVRRVM